MIIIIQIKINNTNKNTNKYQINFRKELWRFIYTRHNRNIEDRHTKKMKEKEEKIDILRKIQKSIWFKRQKLNMFDGKHKQNMTILPKQVTSMVADTEGKYVGVLSPRQMP